MSVAKPFTCCRQDGTGQGEFETTDSAIEAARILAAKKPGVGVVVTHTPSGNVVFDTVVPAPEKPRPVKPKPTKAPRAASKKKGKRSH